MPDRWTIAFDADDTLWHNERFFRSTQSRFVELLREHAGEDHLRERLLAAERRNLGRYGFGVKGFVLSMIETAIEVSDARVPATAIEEIMAMGRDMLAHPIELLPGVREAVEALSGAARLMLVTKGDLLDQERKLAQSGLGDAFEAVEIVSDKTAPVYAAIFARHAVTPARAVMVGNSLKSDVIPVIEAGGWGIHVPFEATWELEHAEPPLGHPRFRRIDSLATLPAEVARLRA
ncbi:HAD family hydrolase [Limimaricola sp.]|uniref:HAD family hydrolase n=1 Tax=Limimaricola sp. TaxID=2211665 RepID=UPI00405A1829